MGNEVSVVLPPSYPTPPQSLRYLVHSTAHAKHGRLSLDLVARQEQGGAGPMCWSFCQDQKSRRP